MNEIKVRPSIIPSKIKKKICKIKAMSKFKTARGSK